VYYFNKKISILKQFDEATKINYVKLGNKKFIFWFIVYLLSIALQIIPPSIAMLFFGIILGLALLATGNIQNLSNIQSGLWAQWFSLAVQTALVILSFFLYIKFVEKRPFSSIGLKGNGKAKKYLKGAVLAIIMQLAYFIIVITFGWAEVTSTAAYATTAMGVSAIGYVLLFLIGFIIQGASEEVVVRGWMLPVMARHYKVSTSIILSSLFFGLLHIMNPNISTLSIINLVLYGVFAALYSLYDDGLWGVFAYHSIWNWFMGNVLGLPVSGMIAGKVSIIETRITGPAWITGGSFGPEGGAIVTLILSISIVIIIKLLIKKGLLISSKDSLKTELDSLN
jgi:membrane protease YdiL (CAAX protease family)